MKPIAYILFLCFLLAGIPGEAQSIPAGTLLPVMLGTSIDGSKAKPGDRVVARLMQDVRLPSGQRIGAGAKVKGQVIAATPASSSGASQIALRFDKLVAGDKVYSLTAGLRALASAEEVFAAQLPVGTFDDYGTSTSDWTTVQIGGAVVYRGDGTVRQAMEVVGKTTDSGAVTARLLPNPKRGCPAGTTVDDADGALWLFSPWACGTYDFAELQIVQSGFQEPVGEVRLSAPKAVRLPGGSGWLLLALEPVSSRPPSSK